MRRIRIIPVVYLCILGSLVLSCITIPQRGSSDSIALVTVVQIEPALGSVLNQTSVITATVKYSIDNFRSGRDHYFAMIVFDEPSKPTTFSPSPRGRSEIEHRITSPSGELTFKCNMADVWDDLRMGDDVGIYFYVNEKWGSKVSQVIGKTERLAFGLE